MLLPFAGSNPKRIEKIGLSWEYAFSSSSGTIPFPARAITPGNTVVVTWRYESGVRAATSVTDTVGAIYTAIKEINSDPTVGIAICLRHPGADSTNVITVNLSAARAYRHGGCYELSNVASYDQVVHQRTQSGITTMTVPFGASTSSGVAICVAGAYNAGTQSAPSSDIRPDTTHGFHVASGKRYSSSHGAVSSTVGAGGEPALVLCLNALSPSTRIWRPSAGAAAGVFTPYWYQQHISVGMHGESA